MKSSIACEPCSMAVIRDVLSNNAQQFANRLLRYNESSPEVQGIINEMVEIVSDKSSTEDERSHALDALVEALFPELAAGQEPGVSEDSPNHFVLSKHLPGVGMVTRKVFIPAESLKYVTGLVDIRYHFTVGGVEWVRLDGVAEWMPWIDEGATIPYYMIEKAEDGSLRARKVSPQFADVQLLPTQDIVTE